MAQVKFGKGTSNQYETLGEKRNGMIFFNTEKNQIYLNGTAYGVTPDQVDEISKIGDAFVGVDYANGIITFTDNNDKTKTVTIPLATDSTPGLMSAGQVTQLNSNTTTITKLDGEVTVAGSVKNQVETALNEAKKHTDDKIGEMDFAKLSSEHKFVSLISQTDGKINAEISEVTAGDVVFKTEEVTDPETGEKTTTVTYTDTILEDLIKDVESLNNLVGGEEGEGVADQIQSAINNLDVAKVGETGKYLQFIAQTDGKIEVTEAKQVAADEVSFSNNLYDDTTETVDDALTEVMTDLKEVSQKLTEVENAAKSYSLTAATEEELAGLGVNVLEAYKLVDEDEAQAGDWIKIYKDSSLVGARLDGQKLILTYSTYIPEQSSWENKDVEIDVSTFLAESEFKNGLEVLDSGVVQVKIDENSEGFLSVSEAGVKISGIQGAINQAIESLDASAGNSEVPEGKHVAVKIIEENGKITAVNVEESDIASADSLTGEINRASGVENAIIDGVGLAEDGNYKAPETSYCLKDSTSIMDAISKLDTAISVLEWWEEDTPSAE